MLLQICTIQETPIEHSFDPQIEKLLLQYSDVFVEPTKLSPPRSHDHWIPLVEGTNPISLRPYRCPHYRKNEIEKLEKELHNSGLIRPSQSPFSSPVLLVRKKDGSLRFCVDYRALNRASLKDKFPIPIIKELLDGASIFFKVDLLPRYHQVRVHLPDIEKTVFLTHDGHFEFLVMPFGLTNAPTIFQGQMNDIFSSFLRKFTLIYFNDILVYSTNSDGHMTHLKLILDTLRENELYAKRSK